MGVKYVGLDALSHFFDRLVQIFSTKEELENIQNNVITNEKVDEICGMDMEDLITSSLTVYDGEVESV